MQLNSVCATLITVSSWPGASPNCVRLTIFWLLFCDIAVLSDTHFVVHALPNTPPALVDASVGAKDVIAPNRLAVVCGKNILLL